MTGANIVKLAAATHVGAVVQAANTLAALNPTSARQLELAGNATRCDRVHVDLGQAILPTGDTGGFAKNGAIRLTLSGTTPKTIDLTDLTSGADSYAGDTTFASFSTLTLFNDGAAAVTFAPGGSNPASVGLAGTTPTLSVGAGVKHSLNYASPVTVSGSAKNITITPTSGGSFILCVGGA